MSEFDMLRFEELYASQGCKAICGVDEAGRGPLAGPVCAAAVIFPPGLRLEEVNDSKKLTEKKREKLFDIIRQEAVAYNIAWADVEEIERLNILNAAMLAMKRAVEGLPVPADIALIDGNKRPELSIPCVDIVKGDALSQSIAAASILAKVSRDRLMLEMSREYPGYGFEKHKGYGTKLHCEKLLELGPCPIHRPSFLKKLFDPSAGRRTKKQQTGDRGEFAALEYLTGQGWRLMDKNYHSRYGEIDIIVTKDNVIAFVEVKTRDAGSLSSPAEAVDKSKQKKLMNTANVYLSENPCDLEPRFDVVEIISGGPEQRPEINHIPDAFPAEWEGGKMS